MTALHALHAKALMVYAEIICLLENGFPDGAYAHFRMLYELWAVAEFINQDTDDVAKAYIESANNKSDSETDHYKWAKKSERFAGRESDITISNIVTEAHKAFKARINDDVSNSHLKKIYTFPNAIIHPSAKGVFGRTSEPVGNIMLIGSADTGFHAPAVNASKTMFNITHLFLSMHYNPVSVIGIRILDNIIGGKIAPIFEDIKKQQKEDLL